MLRRSGHSPYLLIAALAMLSLRALTPDGYMPGSKGSGLLFELCPSGVPQAVMRSLYGGSHHHHHGGSETASASGTEQCPIGHMLGSAAATDISAPTDVLPDSASLAGEERVLRFARAALTYRSRAPPA